MKVRGTIASTVAVSLAFAACTKVTAPTPTPTPTRTAATNRPPDVKTGQTYPLQSCSSIGAPSPTGVAYAIRLTKKFQLRDPDVGKSQNARRVYPRVHAHKTRLDIPTQISKDGFGHQTSGTIKIELEDSTLHFSDGGLALLGATPNAPAVFCDVTFQSGADPRWVIFTTFPAGSNTSASYNLGLLADDKFDSTKKLPIYIDPWVDNNGYN